MAMMLRYSFNQSENANRVERAVRAVLADGHRTSDIYQPGAKKVGTMEMGEAVVAALARLER